MNTAKFLMGFFIGLSMSAFIAFFAYESEVFRFEVSPYNRMTFKGEKL